MSPLAALILRVMRAGAIGAAGFVALVIAIEIWKRFQYETAPESQGYRFFIVLAIMLVGALWLARSITKELRKSGS